MPGVTQIVFGARHLRPEHVAGKKVIDVGACDFNGSIRPLIESWGPAEYVGVDIIPGPCVDVVCNADDLLTRFGEEQFDIVLSIEMLEHSRHWQRSIMNMKRLCKKGGYILLTTRSQGYPCHGFPHDFWRFERTDMEVIFSDFELLSLESDPANPGVFVFARRPRSSKEISLEKYTLYSVLTNERIHEVPSQLSRNAYYRRLRLKQRIKDFSGHAFITIGKLVSRLLRI